MKQIHNDLKEINRTFIIIIVEMIVFTVILSAFIIGATINMCKQLNDFNAELDQKYAQIEQQFNRINSRYEQSKN